MRKSLKEEAALKKTRNDSVKVGTYSWGQVKVLIEQKNAVLKDYYVSKIYLTKTLLIEQS